jgi:hypothetical protein
VDYVVEGRMVKREKGKHREGMSKEIKRVMRRKELHISVSVATGRRNQINAA